MSDQDNLPELMTVAEVCALLGVIPRTLREWGRKNHGPRAINIGIPGAGRPTLRYRRVEVRAFISGLSPDS